MTLDVVHVLPRDVNRGAQRYAQALRSALDGTQSRHGIVTLFRSPSVTLEPDVALGLGRGLAQRAGFDPRVALRLGRTFRDESPEVVVAHGSESLKYVVASAWRGHLIYYKIGIADLRPPRRIRRLWHSALLRAPDMIAAVSDDCRAEAEQEFGVGKERLRVIPNGRDPSVFHPTDRPHDATVRVVFVGHLTPTKRPELVVRAWKRLREDGRRVEALLVGGGPLLTQLQREAVPGLEITGPRSDVPTILRASDVLLFTSIPAGEGMPGVLIEGGLSGLPVVTTDVPGARDVVVDGVTGFVVPHDDEDALVDALARVVDDQALRANMGAAARSRCEQHFTLEASARQWANLLSEVATP